VTGMDALAAVNARVADVRDRLAQVSVAPFPMAPPGAPGAAAAAATPPASAGAAPVAGAAEPAATPHVAGSCASCNPGALGAGARLPGGQPSADVVRASYRAAGGSSLGAWGLAPTGAPAAGTTGPAGPWADRLPERGRPWAGAIESAAAKAGVDPRLLAALAQQESGFRPDARSGAGAIGLTQLMPGTARELGVDPHDPVANLEGGARYLRAQLDRFGSVDLALAAYNAGPARVARTGAVPDIQQTQDYVRKVTANWASLR